ncbi:Bug family tripartite tricarboxylate transporter substrate binding protein [Cupriavidus sp. 2TAF22]|uniref:Bug family tripartite tricarboxylate transporter substrate binding protein n=1 Tax=unclassified Cupriavidus TaxID=2640874 RepID=UPI003F91BE44
MRWLSALPRLVALGLACVAMPALADGPAFPTLKPVSLVVPYPAGGASDVSARIFSEPIGRALGQQVLVENVAGGTGVLGAKRVLNGPPDGYAMLHGSPSEVILTPLLNASARYKPEDFRLVQPITEATIVLLVRGDLPVHTLDEFIELARRPGAKPLTYGTVGMGSLYHVLTEYLGQRTGAKFLHVPYKGAAPAIQDLAGGQIDFAVLAYQVSMDSMARQGRLKVVSSFSRTLPAQLKHIPTLRESKLLPDFEYVIGGGYYVRKGTPDDVVRKLRVAIGKALAQPELRARLESEGRTVLHAVSEQEADAWQAAQVSRYRGMVDALGLKPM